MSAMPGRLMSLMVIGTRASSPWVRTSSERVSRCCSYSCAIVICAVLIEFKQSYLSVLQAIGDPHASPIRLREREHGQAALEEHPHGLVHRQGPLFGPRSDDLDPAPIPLRRLRRQLGNPLLPKARSALLSVLQSFLPTLQRLLLLFEHGVERRPRIRILGSPGQVHTVPENAKLRQVAVALLGHGQLRADQVGEVSLQLLDSPLRVRAVVGSHLPVPPLDRDLHRYPLNGSCSIFDP